MWKMWGVPVLWTYARWPNHVSDWCEGFLLYVIDDHMFSIVSGPIPTHFWDTFTSILVLIFPKQQGNKVIWLKVIFRNWRQAKWAILAHVVQSLNCWLSNKQNSRFCSFYLEVLMHFQVHIWMCILDKQMTALFYFINHLIEDMKSIQWRSSQLCNVCA